MFILFQQKYLNLIITFFVFRCLLDVTLRDIIRENDGDMMMTMWRLHMTDFYNNNHYKYLILGHRLLSGTFRTNEIFFRKYSVKY